MTVYISNLTNPFINLSLGSYIFTKSLNKNILFLATSSPHVSIGRNQNCWKECNMHLMKQDNIPLIRRDTGGCACYLDNNVRLFAFSNSNSNRTSTNKNFNILLYALKQFNPIHIKNDILINNKKVSGSAFTLQRHHGTILLDVDKDKLQKYLTPNKLKLQSHGIESVRSRVINLSELDSDYDFDNHIIRSFAKFNTKPTIIYINNPPNDDLFNYILNSFKNNEFIYNKNSYFTHKIELKSYEILFECKENKIIKCTIFSDSCDIPFVYKLKNFFINKEYNYNLIEELRLFAPDIADELEKKL